MPTRRIAYAYYDPDWIKGEHTLLALGDAANLLI